ncbi:hypothetical protein [Paraburkholderia antibiotica]|uniref:OmpA family protein n=1 Tax=Paraburkholderia antibiotica TaxID=2728839 RepID=A0A7Y0FFU5_9BURK|nr:hypothetical protein [Paraburkholderia antibiotica]NML34430.1 hypothetical protein [Paraburkholderia antibiotica]
MRKLYVILLVLMSGHVFACMPGENFDIYFPPNSAIIPTDEILRLANWVVDQKITYANHKTKETMLVSGHAEENEQNPAQLAQARLAAGKAMLDQLGFLRGTLKTSSRIYSKNDVENGRRVEISFEPDCPNKCCTGQ